jgi:GGDEF domain-containing protein
MDTYLRARLESKGLFRNIDLGELEHRLDECARYNISAGTTLLEPGARNDCLYVVVRGELRVHLGGGDLPAHATVGVGECVGEISLIDGQGVSALVVAARDSELLVVPQEMLWALINRSHGFARNLLGMLSGRLRNDHLALMKSANRCLEFELAASVDALTGLHNRRWLTEAFTRSIRRCKKDGTPLCLVMTDIDHFKRINDAHGHLMGDTVLRAVARRLADSLRMAVERMSLTKLTGSAVRQITVSCGVAPLGLDASLDNLISSADAALYRAKASGCNRVEAAN